jgi:preprotein translocase subunit SecD
MARGCPYFHEVHPSLKPLATPEDRIPAGWKIYPSAGNKQETLLLRETPLLSGASVADAQAGVDKRTNMPIVKFRFDRAGAQKFAVFTSASMGRPFAVVIDGLVISSPVIRDPILGGEGQISGAFAMVDAEQLATRLRSGACR